MPVWVYESLNLVPVLIDTVILFIVYCIVALNHLRHETNNY